MTGGGLDTVSVHADHVHMLIGDAVVFVWVFGATVSLCCMARYLRVINTPTYAMGSKKVA